MLLVRKNSQLIESRSAAAYISFDYNLFFQKFTVSVQFPGVF